MAYDETNVPCMSSWGEICKVLYAHGCEATAYAEKPGEGFEIQFVRKIQGNPRLVRIPVKYSLSPKKDRNGRSKALTEAQIAQEMRTKWRSLFYYLKAVFDAIDKGIVLYEQAFLADVVGTLPNGTEGRFIEAALPSLMDGRFNGVRMLPEPPKENKTTRGPANANSELYKVIE